MSPYHHRKNAHELDGLDFHRAPDGVDAHLAPSFAFFRLLVPSRIMMRRAAKVVFVLGRAFNAVADFPALVALPL